MNVVFYAVQAINGNIAHDHNEAVLWNSKEDREFFFSELRRHGVAIMGRRTYEAVGELKSGWLRIVLTHDPNREKSIPGAVEFTGKPLKEILADLKERGFSSVAVAGGASVYTRFLQEGLADEIMLTIEPKIFGKGIGMFEEMETDFPLELLESKKLSNQTILLRYRVLK